LIIYYLPTHGDAAARLDRLTRTEDPAPTTSCRSGTCGIKNYYVHQHHLYDYQA
jgi:hypothetical protein